jgi:hypothetical protein
MKLAQDIEAKSAHPASEEETGGGLAVISVWYFCRLRRPFGPFSFFSSPRWPILGKQAPPESAMESGSKKAKAAFAVSLKTTTRFPQY